MSFDPVSSHRDKILLNKQANHTRVVIAGIKAQNIKARGIKAQGIKAKEKYLFTVHDVSLCCKKDLGKWS